MKKLTAIFLAVFLCLSMCAVPAGALEADVTLEVGAVSGDRGDTVEVPISITRNTGLTILAFNVAYDSNVLEPVYDEEDENPFDKVELLSVSNYGADSQWPTKNPYFMSWAYALAKSDSVFTGTIATFKFKIKANAALGASAVTVTVIESSKITGADNITSVAKQGSVTVVCTKHVAGTPVVTQNATCTEAGKTTTRCSICNAVMSVTDLPVATGHNWGEWTETKAATCTEKGQDTRVCQNDATHIETREVAMLPHTYTDAADITCNVCGFVRTIAPVTTAVADKSVTLAAYSEYEYSKDGTTWQSGNVFTGLISNTQYTFYQRVAATGDKPAGAASTGLSVTTIKSTVNAPAAPVVEARTANSVTLTATAGNEYKMNDGAWQTGNVFTGLLPNTEYTFYQRVAETDRAFASEPSAVQKATTLKNTVAAPAAPAAQDKTANSVTLTATAGNEYKMDDGEWQTGNVFTGLLPNTEHTFYQRVADTETAYASVSSEGLKVTTLKSTVATPAAPAAQDKTANSVTLTATAGNEYKMDDGAWQTSNAFTGLLPNTEHTFYQRAAETQTAYASNSSDGLKVTTLKSTVAAPAAPTMASHTESSVTLTATAGYEYKLGDGAWQTSNVFTGLAADTQYTFYQRVAETQTAYASAPSAVAELRTDLQHVPGDIDGDREVKLHDVVVLAQYVAGWSGLNYIEPSLNVDKIGEVDLSDVVYLSRYIAGWDGYVLS